MRMIKLSDDAQVLPLKTIFMNCLRRGIFPEIWKYANVVPIHKKNEKKREGKLPSYFSFTNFWKNTRKTHIRFSLLTSCITCHHYYICIPSLLYHYYTCITTQPESNQVFAQEIRQSTSYFRYHILFSKPSTVILRLMFAQCTLTFRRHLIEYGTTSLRADSTDPFSDRFSSCRVCASATKSLL